VRKLPDDHWFNERYDDLLYDEQAKGHPQGEPEDCSWCTCLGDGVCTDPKCSRHGINWIDTGSGPGWSPKL